MNRKTEILKRLIREEVSRAIRKLNEAKSEYKITRIEYEDLDDVGKALRIPINMASYYVMPGKADRSKLEALAKIVAKEMVEEYIDAVEYGGESEDSAIDNLDDIFDDYVRKFKKLGAIPVNSDGKPWGGSIPPIDMNPDKWKSSGEPDFMKYVVPARN